MAFSDNYYQEIVNTWIKAFLKNTANELLLRNILSRGYYTMYLHCRDIHDVDLKMTNFNITDESHMSIIRMISDQGIQTFVHTYKKYRERADYDVKPLTLPVTVKFKNLQGVYIRQSLPTVEMVPEHIAAVLEYK